jgi:hypothetical protein
MKRITNLSVLCLVFALFLSSNLFAQKREFYELKIYHIENAQQAAMLDSYLEKAYLPAAHRQGIESVGVFKPIASQPDAGKKVYVLTPFKSMKKYLAMEEKLAKDHVYQTAGSAYLQATFDNPPYKRIENSLLQAMTGQPKFTASPLTGPKKDRIYEFRSYEGPTERLYKQKVKMFNSGEMDIFKRLGFNAIFYAETIAGANMPNLVYLTTHENKEKRDANWKAFSADYQWAEMKDLEEYKNTVSKNDTRLLYPADYSDF